MTTPTQHDPNNNPTLHDTNARAKHVDAITDYAWTIRHSDPERAGILAQEAFGMAESMHYVRGMAEALAVASSVHLHQSAFDEVILVGIQALHLFELIADAPARRLEPYVRGNVAESYLALHDFESALTNLERQLNVAEALNDSVAQAQGLKNLSRIYIELDDFSTALSYLNEALYYASPAQVGEIYTLLAETSMAMGDIAAAKTHAGHGLQRLRLDNIPDRHARVSLHATLAEVALSEKRLSEAREHLQSAWEYSRTSSGTSTIVTLLMMFGKLRVVENDVPEALNSYQRALAFATAREDLQRQYQCHEALAALYEMREDYPKALMHHKKYSLLRRQSLLDQNNLRIHHLEMLMRTRISQQEARFYEERTRQLEILRERDRDYFEELSNIKDDMMRTASHDLKNPLATVITLCYLLRQHTADPTHLKLIDRIEHQTGRMKLLISDLLDLAKLETGRAIELNPYPIETIIRDSATDAEPLATAQSIELHVNLEAGLHAAVDPPRLRQVVDNLLSNAIKYSPRGGIIVLAGHVEEAPPATGAQPTPQVVFSVADTGLGIPQEDLPRIFDRFYRVTEDDHQQREGTGLGLTIVKTIVKQHGGDIGVHSELNQGTTFTVRLPYVELAAPASDYPLAENS